MNSDLSFGLIGAGGIARSYIEAFAELPGTRIAAVADTDPTARQRVAGQLDCPHFSDCDELLQNVAIDGAIVCTPPSSHAEIAIRCLQSHVPVLCEKPFALDLPSATAMLDAAARSGVLITMASKFRYVQDVVKARNLLTTGTIGKVVLFENAFTARVDMSNRWNSIPETSGGGVLIDNGTHSVDIVRYFLGPIGEVSAVEARRIQQLPVEDTVRLFVRSRAGAVGTVDLSWSVNKELESYIDIFGSDGILRVGWRESKYRTTSSKDWVVFGNGYDKLQALRAQILNFCGAVRGQEALWITAEDAVASVAVVEAAYRSMQDNHWVAVEPSGILS